jgi:hypothetical protein
MSPTMPAALPIALSLPEAAQTAVLRQLPLVVMTTLKGCPYCDVVRGHYLLPMHRSGQIQAVQMDMADRVTAIRGVRRPGHHTGRPGESLAGQAGTHGAFSGPPR